jgi:two-component system sensor histidine kinase YesM
VPAHTPLSYALLALGSALWLGLVYMFFAGIFLPLLTLRRMKDLSEGERAEFERRLKRAPWSGLILNDILRLTSLLYARDEKQRLLEALKKEAELSSLRSQINPHFLYNTLDSIRGQLMSLGFSGAAEIIESLSNLFRYSIDPRAVYNTLEQELDNVADYMRIMRFRLGDRLRFQTVVDAQEGYILNCEMPKLTLQPIVENAIEHGLSGMRENARIELRAYVAQEGLNILISDNGAGIEPRRLDELSARLREGSAVEKRRGAGLALVNVNERIRLLHGGEPYGLRVVSEVGVGTQVHILLPVRLMPEGHALRRDA